MKTPPISPQAVEAAFRQRVADATPPGTPLTMRRALDVMCRFYAEVSIAGVDVSDPDYDMLLFQWGPDGLPGGPDRRYCLDVTRQYQLEGEEEFWQLRLSLYFPPEHAPFGAGSQWSADYDELADWRREAEQQVPAGLWDVPAAQVEIGLSET